MNKDELMAKSKEELIEEILKMKEGGKCACKCDTCGKCAGFKGEEGEAKK